MPSKASPAPRTPTRLRARRICAVAVDVQGAAAGDHVGVLDGLGHAPHQRLGRASGSPCRPGTGRRSAAPGPRRPSGGLNGVTGGIGTAARARDRVLDEDDRQHRSLRLIPEAQALDVRPGSMFTLSAGCGMPIADLRAPVRLARARHRPRRQVEDVADVLGELVEVGRSVPFCTGIRFDGTGMSGYRDRDDLGDDAEARRTCARMSAARASGRRAGVGQAGEGR